MYYRNAINTENVIDEKETIVERATLSKDQEDELSAIARKLMEPGKGILAADESIDTIGKRFAAIGMENNAKNRKNYRHLLFTTPNISQYISGIILHEETFDQCNTTTCNVTSAFWRLRKIIYVANFGNAII
ncbi:Fructose-bisphosphate aldolase [Dirofilaria immitis]|nr:Fructose-bisphosphate aldolase [Dirofilaria immitis]